VHPAYQDLFLARITTAIAAARAAKGITHKLLLGEIRELLIRDLFKPLLPSDIGVTTGQIITHTGQSSTQLDIILYDKRILPPILFQDHSGLIPIESALYIVEVKSTLNATALRETHDAAAMLRSYDLIPGASNMKPNYTLFALTSDLTDSSEVDRYERMCGADPPLCAICVVGRGYWYWQGNTWTSWPPDYELCEVVGFLTGILNTYRTISESRGTPKLGRYLKMPT
jgi:hypothetical protein